MHTSFVDLIALDLNQFVEVIPDFPKPGILFRDIRPMIRDPLVWEKTLTSFEKGFSQIKADVIIGIESRGFIVGSALAYKMKIGFVPIRKKSKLAGDTISIEYELEYGTDKLEIQKDSLNKKDRVLIIDDLLATGGTAGAAMKLVKRLEAQLVGFGFIIELNSLQGREKLPKNCPIVSLLKY